MVVDNVLDFHVVSEHGGDPDDISWHRMCWQEAVLVTRVSRDAVRTLDARTRDRSTRSGKLTAQSYLLETKSTTLLQVGAKMLDAEYLLCIWLNLEYGPARVEFAKMLPA